MNDEPPPAEDTIQTAAGGPVVIPFGLPRRDSAGWRFNPQEEEIPVAMEEDLTSSMEDPGSSLSPDVSHIAAHHLQPLLKTQGKCLVVKHFSATGNGYCLCVNFPILV